MKLIKPQWLEHAHENKPMEIYTVCVSPDGKRLASGGFDGKVRVWSTEATRDPTAEGPRQLASMSAHTGSVVVTRFSPNGRYIASGSDDKLVLIWELDASRVAHKEFGTTDQVHEVWTARKKLADHESDIQDLAWSPDGSLLVTVGLDSAIIVWSGTTFEKLARIDTHSSHIKGVAFDPANKYFVTCSDDRSARIIRYQGTGHDFTFSIEAVIEMPFSHSPLTTYFRRCSWSPDGETIACPNSTNGPVPTVSILDRGSWKADVSLVGHEGPVEVCLFSSRAYQMGESQEPVTIVASAGSDNTVAIWSTSSPRPLLIVNALTQKTITDLAWTPDGLGLYAASLDGSISLILFQNELGTVMPLDQITQSLLRYGSAQTDMDIPESAEQLKVSEKLQAVPAAEESKKDGTPQSSRLDASSSMTDVPAVPAESTGSDSAAPAAQTASAPAAPAGPATAVDTPAPATAATQQVNVLPPVKKQKTTVTKDGRKRVAPMLISQDTSVPTSVTAAIASAPQSNGVLRPASDFSRPQNGIPRGGIPSLLVGTKRKPEDDESEAVKQKLPEFIRPAVVNPACVVSSARLAIPKVFTHLSTDSGASSVMEARNGADARDPARITVVHDGKPVFVDFVPGYAHLLAGSGDYFWAATTEDGSVYTWSPAGTRLLAPFCLGSSVVLLATNKYCLLAVTATGLVQAWDLCAKKALFSAISLAPVLDSASKYAENGVLKAPAVTQCWMATEKSVVVTLSNGNGFIYDPDLLVWSRLSEPFWAYGSQYWDSTGFISLFDDGPGGPVTRAERRTNEEAMLKNSARGKQFQRMARNRMLQDGYNGFEDAVSIAHLETRIACAAILESGTELQKYLDLYVNRLSRDGLRSKLAELFRKLSHSRTFGGQDSSKLLKRALEIASTHRPVQTLVVEYTLADDAMES